MRSKVINLGIAIGIAGLAALGGGLAVFSEYDDAPGGVLIGLVMIVGAVVLGSAALHRAGRRAE